MVARRECMIFDCSEPALEGRDWKGREEVLCAKHKLHFFPRCIVCDRELRTDHQATEEVCPGCSDYVARIRRYVASVLEGG